MFVMKKGKGFIFLIIIGMILFSGCTGEPKIKNEIEQKFSEFKILYNEKQSQGYNVTEAEGFIRKARQSYDKKDYTIANELLDKAIDALVNAQKIPAFPGGDSEDPRKKLSMIKVASQYRRVTDGIGTGRSVDDVIEIFKATQTEFIYQGWMRQEPCPETCSDLPKNDQEICEFTGYSYEYLREATSAIKAEMPDIIFGGGILAEFLNPESWNPQTGETFGRDETWEMALDPSKWGIQKSRTEVQTEWAKSRGWVKQGQQYNPKEEMYYYFPDISNPDFQELFLSYAKKQIDSGVDSIWIDMLYVQPEILKRMTGDINHPAVKESYEAANHIIDEIHEYGYLSGRYIYVISWAQPIIFEAPYEEPDLDAFMISISPNEIRNLKMDANKWNLVKDKRTRFDDVPIFVRIDYGNVGSPLSVFSQELTMGSASQFLRIADEFFQKNEIILIYPIHGGNMAGLKGEGEILSYGKYDWYDSLAPEFQTYDTIVELAQNKSV